MFQALIVTIALVATLGGATAGEPKDVNVVMRPVTSFGYLDTDKDSRITRDEAKADWAVAQGFERADTNRDGTLDREEFAILQKS